MYCFDKGPKTQNNLQFGIEPSQVRSQCKLCDCELTCLGIVLIMSDNYVSTKKNVKSIVCQQCKPFFSLHLSY